jgi:hypothetical protein
MDCKLSSTDAVRLEVAELPAWEVSKAVKPVGSAYRIGLENA